MSRSLISLVAVIAIGFGSTACGTETPGGADADVMVATIHAGDDQTAIGNTFVSVPPTVLVTVNGQPKAGVTVLFTILGGGGIIATTQTTTASDGTAGVGSWKLGRPGVEQRLLAVVRGPTEARLNFDATAILGPLYVIGGDWEVDDAVGFQPSIVGTASAGFRIVAMDLAFNPIPGVPLVWRVPQGSGRLVSVSSVTGADGRARATWILDTIAGHQSIWVRADYPGSKEWEIREIADPGPAAIIERVTLEPQVAQAGTQVPIAPRVKVFDRYRNPIGNTKQVVFSVVSGGGSVDNTHQLTDGASTAAVGRWTLGAAPGENRLRATAGTASIEFTATGTP